MEELTQIILQWYDENRRILPWREDPTPYHVWLSEIMLQQTRVEAVKGYYLRFIRQFPDINSLAEAKEDIYLKLWEGLGYYSRVRNLHKAAVMIRDEYNGLMPDTAEELIKLPGIGPYSAAAIASIAFGEKVVAVDGNLLRVFARMTEYAEDIKTQKAKRDAESWFEKFISQERPGDFNQALMDLGACICLPNAASACEKCPWSKFCCSCSHHTQMDYPKMPLKKERKKEKRTILLILWEDRTAIRKRADKGLLSGLYEFPGCEGHLNQGEVLAFLESLGIFKENLLSKPLLLSPARHVFTHVEWEMTGYLVRISGRKMPAGELIWASREELKNVYSIPSAFFAYRELLPGMSESGA